MYNSDSIKSDLLCSGLAAGIYTTNSPEACHYIASNCKANVIVVEDKIQLGKILQVQSTSDGSDNG